MARYYSNYQMNGMLDRLYQNKHFVEKQLEFAKKVLQSIAEGDAGTGNANTRMNTDPASPEGYAVASGEEAEAETREDRAELTREEMIAAAKNALAELNTRKDW